eukprot:gene25690-32176_t
MNLPVHESAPMPASLSEGGLSVLGARGDADAVAIWLQARGSRSIHTQRTYRRIGERLLVWLARTEKTLAEMTVTDAQAHLDSLRSPDVSLLIPRNEVGKLAESLYKSQTLKRPLSAQGFVFSRTVLSQLFQYLMTAGYVRSNVFALQMKDQIKFVEKSIPNLQQMGMQFMSMGTQEELRDQIINKALDIACLQDPLPTDAASFAKRKDEGKSRLVLLVNEVARLLSQVLTEFHGLPSTGAALNRCCSQQVLPATGAALNRCCSQQVLPSIGAALNRCCHQ